MVALEQILMIPEGLLEEGIAQMGEVDAFDYVEQIGERVLGAKELLEHLVGVGKRT